MGTRYFLITAFALVKSLLKRTASSPFVRLVVATATLATTHAAPPLPVVFDAKDNVGVRIRADGKNLLVDDAGAGFYLIGSDDQTDDENNIASFSKKNRGLMRPMNGAATPYIPYGFTFRKDPSNPGRLWFTVSVGPSLFNFTTISMPLDGRREHFTHWRHAGSSTLHPYTENPYSYTPKGGGPIYISAGTGTPEWAEMIGPEFTVRVTLTARTRKLQPFFVEAPHLSTGVRNVEYGFGPVGKGQSASMAGYIDVVRTNPALFAQPPLVFQTELMPWHQIGQRDGDGWSVRVGNLPGRYLAYGPYTTAVQPGNRSAVFRLMIDNITAANNRVVTLEVFDAVKGRVVATRTVTRRQFIAGAMRYTDFTVPFTSTAGASWEFRTLWHGGAYVRQDCVTVR